jgi:hypothetical protein
MSDIAFYAFLTVLAIVAVPVLYACTTVFMYAVTAPIWVPWLIVTEIRRRRAR